MALWKRAGIYYVKLTAPDGTLLRRTTRTSDRQKAEEYHDRLKAQLWDLAYLKKKPKRTWDEAALRWLKEKAHKKSYRDDVARIRWFTKHLRGRTLDQVSRALIDRLISSLGIPTSAALRHFDLAYRNVENQAFKPLRFCGALS